MSRLIVEQAFMAWLEGQDRAPKDLTLTPGMLVVRELDMRVWEVEKRTESGVSVIEPIRRTEKAFIQFGEGVMTLPDFEREFGNGSQRYN